MTLRLAVSAFVSALDNCTSKSRSVWVMMGRDRGDLGELVDRPEWKWLTPDHRPPWSDDFSSLWRIVRWGR